jgi:HSP20 family protein
VLELPGADPTSIVVLVAGRSFTVSGVRERPMLPGARYQQMEIEYGPFQRRIELGEDVDADRATAAYERGLLRIVLPLATRARTQTQITIEVRR